ncbi:hypothetical protein CROQUDRAFT_649904 [Cronartium quercuum f. sp. fusiforme G11]|uniref:Uncharacterized protein n=1 Tax=Cronartium quercuum f. sp. fusiforme G11 TaxID=708437 RepID=A0A9P6NY48_9BASI|nr:hypothetical protein CROQUDRAFT_649904 [Cronartium quercuum f. sp. fusiforme G11]
MGLIAFNCLNLPPTTHNKLGNYCIAGITPGTHKPSVTTINHVLSPIIDQLLTLNTGVNIHTHAYPNGRLVQVKLLGLVGDVVGTHKVAGYALHSATCFCSYCDCMIQQHSKLQIGRRREDKVVRAQAIDYQKAKMITRQEALVKKFGVRWSELNCLEYQDTVDHVILGVMHNWLEGVLQHHWHYRWGFKGARHQSLTRVTQGDRIDKEESDYESEEEAEGWDDDYDLQLGTVASLFSEREQKDFNRLLAGVILPAGINRLPLNLGDARHGKLKAAQWKSLYIYIIPLIVPELLVLDVEDFKKTSTRATIIENIARLCRCTQIVLMNEHTEADCNEFRSMYNRYNDTSRLLFNDTRILPNHHYALHIPDQLCFWGPLMAISEFAGEWMNGLLQKVKTNHRTNEMDSTILTSMCQTQRLESDHPVPKEERHQAKPNTRQILLSDDVYEKLIAHEGSVNQNIFPYYADPLPPNSEVLTCYAGVKKYHWVLGDKKNFGILALGANRCVCFMREKWKMYGMVKQIHMYNGGDGKPKTAVLINPIKDCYGKDLLSPSKNFRYILYLFRTIVGEIEEQSFFIAPDQILSTCAFRILLPQTFGLISGGVILTPVLFSHSFVP